MFGSRPRRKLLEGVLMGQAPKRGWTRPDLAAMADVVANGGVDEHVDGLQRLGLLVADDGTWRPAQPRPELGRAIRRVLVALRETPDAKPVRRSRGRTREHAARRAVRAAERAIAEARDELGSQMANELLGLLGQARRRLEDASPYA